MMTESLGRTTGVAQQAEAVEQVELKSPLRQTKTLGHSGDAETVSEQRELRGPCDQKSKTEVAEANEIAQ